MTQLPVLLARWLRTLTDVDGSVARDAALGNMQRLRWLMPIVLALNLMLLAIFALNPSTGSPVQQHWQRAVMGVFGVNAAWLVVLMLASRGIVRRPGVDRSVRMLQWVAPLSFLLFMVVLTTLDQWVTSAISPYLLGCISISLLFLLPPAVTTWLFISTYALMFVGLGLTQPDPTILLTNRANAFGAALLGLVLSIWLWQRNTQYALLQRELTVRNTLLEQQQEELVRLATRDSLTGLYNRREFMRQAEQELKRAQRHGGDTSAIVIDLDHFKTINDRHGHPAGDQVLVHVAQCLLEGVRATDLVARIGGEEFMVLLPRTDIDAAAGLARKLRQHLHAGPARVNGDLAVPVTASFGVGCLLNGSDGSVATLYAAADKALYDAKRLGRDRVERTEPDASLTPSDFQRMRR